MPSLLADLKLGTRSSVTQQVGVPTEKTFDALDHVLIVMPESAPAGAWRKLPRGDKLKSLLKRRAAGRQPAVTARHTNKRQTALHVGLLDEAADAFQTLTFGRKLVAAVLGEKPGAVGIWVLGFDDDKIEDVASAVTAAALAAAYPMPAFKAGKTKAKIKSIKLIGLADRLNLTRIVAEADGNNLTRCLTALPANKLDAVSYVQFLRKLASEEGWQFRKYSVSELRKMGAGAFLAVAQGNADDSAAIVRLRYRPGSRTVPPALSFVGKGIIFDTGGTNLKPFTSMLDMHIDMGGSALAVGCLLAWSRMGQAQPVDCWLAITENRTGPTAYKSQDVVTAMNGKTIQTIHTDAEGRMALADTLVLACKDNPGLVIDFATLTGACVNAVTSRYSGVFTNRQSWHPVLKRAGRDSGERVWPFPIGGEFREDLKSDTADIAQCAPNGGGDHILAATFLNEFVDEKVPWVHVDLSSCQRKGGLAHVPSEINGFGVRFTMNLLIDKNVPADADRK